MAVLKDAAESGASNDEIARAVTDAEPTLAPLVTRFHPIMRRALIVFLWFVVQTLLQQAISESRDNPPLERT
jgi:hypothetical protein